MAPGCWLPAQINMATQDNSSRDERQRNAPTKAAEAASTADDEGTSSAQLERETYGQTLDPDRDGQQMPDLMDDSMRSDMPPAAGPAPASDENLPRQLTDPSDRAFTLPAEQAAPPAGGSTSVCVHNPSTGRPPRAAARFVYLPADSAAPRFSCPLCRPTCAVPCWNCPRARKTSS